MLDDATTLHPRFRDESLIATLHQQWKADRCMRVTELLRPGLAEELHQAALSGPFAWFERREADISVGIWRRFTNFPEPHTEIEAVISRDVPALISAVTGRELSPPDSEGVAFDRFEKGSYLDAHTDQASHRVVAWVIGLTHDSWPAEEGGHLEFLAPDGKTVVDRREPGFDTLDFYAIYPMLRWHRVPLLTTHHTRLATNGWLTGPVHDPWERT